MKRIDLLTQRFSRERQELEGRMLTMRTQFDQELLVRDAII